MAFAALLHAQAAVARQLAEHFCEPHTALPLHAVRGARGGLRLAWAPFYACGERAGWADFPEAFARFDGG